MTAQRIAIKIVNNNYKQESAFDTQGSYTGVCTDDKFDIPVQDADDL